MARIEHFVDVKIMDRTNLEIHELDTFLGWMSQILDQNWVDSVLGAHRNAVLLRSQASLSLKCSLCRIL